MRLLFTDYTGTIPTLAGPITNTATALVLQAGQGALLPNPGQNQYFIITMIPASTGLPGEIMWCTARATDTLTVIRGQEGTTATAYLAGDSVAPQVTANVLASFAQIPTYPGNPNGLIAGQAGTAEQSPDAVWDTVNAILWVCTTGNSSPGSTIWQRSASSKPLGITTVTATGAYSVMVPAGASFCVVQGWGAGGGGGYGSTTSNCSSGASPGAYGTVNLTVTPGTNITGSVGTGGLGSSSGSAGGAGGNTTVIYNAVTYTAGGGPGGLSEQNGSANSPSPASVSGAWTNTIIGGQGAVGFAISGVVVSGAGLSAPLGGAGGVGGGGIPGAGEQPGGGGGGSGDAAGAGGNGGDGQVTLTFY